MAGVWLIPAHAWTLAYQHRSVSERHRSSYGLVVLVALSIVLGVAAFVGVNTLPVVFRCLYESRCTGTRAGALIFLDIFGVAVVVVELLWQALRLYEVRRRGANQADARARAV
jgi:hypothetical protein